MMRKLLARNQHAFSLLEIIIAITIIAIFTVLPILAYTSYQKKARDEKRKSDIAKVSQALESYKAEKGSYPPDLQTLVTSGFLPELPKDPLEGQKVPWDPNGGTFSYAFSSPDGTTYSLSATMEQGGASGGSAGGSGTSAMTGGNISGTFTGTGNGAINSATVNVSGIVTNGVFKGSFNGSVTGAGLSGTINGVLSKSVTGTASGNVAGTATVTTGTVTGSNFTGTYAGFNVTGVAGAGGSAGGGDVCIANPQNPTCQVIPVITLTLAAQATPTGGAPTATGYLSPTPIGSITVTPTATNTPTNTPTPITFVRRMPQVYPSQYSRLSSAALLNDGNIVAVGYRNSYAENPANGPLYGLIVKFNTVGTQIWSKGFQYSPATQYYYVRFKDVTATSDGGFAAVGEDTTCGFYWCLVAAKFDTNGTVTWWKRVTVTTPQNGTFMPGRIVQAADGGFFVSGSVDGYLPQYTSGTYAYHAFLMKFDTAGNISWQKYFTNVLADYYFGNDLIKTADGGVVMTGQDEPTGGGNYSGFLLKSDTSGNLSSVWRYNSGTSGNIRAVVQLADGGYIIAGYNSAPFVARLDNAGGVTWAKNWSTNPIEIQQAPDGNFVILSTWGSYGAIQVNKMDINGTVLWSTKSATDQSWVHDFESTVYKGEHLVILSDNSIVLVANGDASDWSYMKAARLGPDGKGYNSCTTEFVATTETPTALTLSTVSHTNNFSNMVTSLSAPQITPIVADSITNSCN